MAKAYIAGVPPSISFLLTLISDTETPVYMYFSFQGPCTPKYKYCPKRVQYMGVRRLFRGGAPAKTYYFCRLGGGARAPLPSPADAHSVVIEKLLSLKTQTIWFRLDEDVQDQKLQLTCFHLSNCRSKVSLSSTSISIKRKGEISRASFRSQQCRSLSVVGSELIKVSGFTNKVRQKEAFYVTEISNSQSKPLLKAFF